MIKRKRAFTLRYGESNKNDFLIYIENGDTLIQTLNNVIPPAVQRGFLPQDCRADRVKLLYKGQELNPNLSLEEQSPDIKERAILILRDLTSTVKLRIQYKPDHNNQRMDTIDVSPAKPLGTQLEDFMAGIQKSYTFFRRKPKKFHLVYGDKKLILNRSLAGQGIESGVDCKLVPRLIFRWPPSALAIKIAAGVLAILLVLGFWGIYTKFLRGPRVIDTYHVTFMADSDCDVSVADTVLHLVTGLPQVGNIPPGLHEIEVMPASFPIFRQNLMLSTESVDGDSVLENLDIASKSGDLGTVKLAIGGYRGEPTAADRIFEPILINGQPHEVDEFGALQIELVRGEYEIKFSHLDDKLQKVDFDAENKVLRPDTFRFDFSQFKQDETYLTFTYSQN